MLKHKLLIAGICLAVALLLAWWFGLTRFVIGILTYGRQVREGTLTVGDDAPRVTLYELDGETPRRLGEWIGEKPLVLVFGSFT